MKVWTVLRASLRWLWHDPVFSKVIATGVLAGLGYLFARRSASLESASPFLKPLAVVAIVAAVLLCMWVVFIVYRGRKTKTLVFLSSGGTCRDPMAKAILEKLLEHRRLKHRLVIRAVSLGPVSGTEASYAAKYVIREMFGEDLLADHKPERLTPELSERADLILAMDESLLGKGLPKDKTYVLKEFFGLGGDVCDPWPDGREPGTLARYRECAAELREILGSNLDDLAKVLDL
jgi:protein-tyrosine-phosphatase